MKNFLAAFLFLFSITATADDWTRLDAEREVVYLIVDAMDWAQTRNIARNPDRWYETNAILGDHPSVDKVDAYFVGMALAHCAIAAALPADYRAAFQYATIGIEVGYVHRNLQLGIGIKF
ncbi:MAG: hypothetical protein WC236_09640 [Gallionellaceae bacterium]|jgi:hypothetical protein